KRRRPTGRDDRLEAGFLQHGRVLVRTRGIARHDENHAAFIGGFRSPAQLYRLSAALVPKPLPPPAGALPTPTGAPPFCPVSFGNSSPSLEEYRCLRGGRADMPFA